MAITQRLELIGFGAQISGKLERVDSVAQALDSEGFETQKEQTDSVGARHHSAYSLCNALHDVVAVVVSQDGTAQLVKWNDGMVTVWEQLSPSLIDAQLEPDEKALLFIHDSFSCWFSRQERRKQPTRIVNPDLFLSGFSSLDGGRKI